MRVAISVPSRSTLLAGAAATLALILLALVAWWGAIAIENRTVAAIKSRLLGDGITWASVSADGLQIRLEGTAPNEAARFRAVNLAGGVVDAGRIDDQLEVTALRAIEAPRFSVEVLRNGDGVSLIGLVPAGEDGTTVTLSADVAKLAGGVPVADMDGGAAPPATVQDLDLGGSGRGDRDLRQRGRKAQA
jgi:OmpA-OmpF porin, OOP family